MIQKENKLFKQCVHVKSVGGGDRGRRSQSVFKSEGCIIFLFCFVLFCFVLFCFGLVPFPASPGIETL